MRKHRISGVVIAVLVGLGPLTHRSDTSTPKPGTDRAGVQLASADVIGAGVEAVETTAAADRGGAGPGVLPHLTAGRARAIMSTPFGVEALGWDVQTLSQERSEASAYVAAVYLTAAHRRAVASAYLAAQAVAHRAPPAPAVRAAVSDPWAALRRCESNGDYGADTGNGYYGAYQFTLGTWESLGYRGLPSQASPAEQDQAAQTLEARRGWGQWPSCARQLGLL
jgi:hypothetical protein